MNGAALGFALSFFFAALMGRADVPERGRAVATAMGVVLYGSNVGALLGFRPAVDSDGDAQVTTTAIVSLAIYLAVATVLIIAEHRAQAYNNDRDKTIAHKPDGSPVDAYVEDVVYCQKCVAKRSMIPMIANVVAVLATGVAGFVVWVGGAGQGSLTARRQGPLAVLLLLLLSGLLSIWVAVTRDKHAASTHAIRRCL